LAFATPFPVTLISTSEWEPLFTSVRMPCAYPRAGGVKITGNRTVAPGAISAGKGKSPTVNALPRTFMAEITRVPLPLFASWKEKGLESPSWTLPNPCAQGSHCNCWAHTGVITNPQNTHAITNRGRHRINQSWRGTGIAANSEVHSSHFQFRSVVILSEANDPMCFAGVGQMQRSFPFGTAQRRCGTRKSLLLLPTFLPQQRLKLLD
jgi:hypothetical protein